MKISRVVLSSVLVTTSVAQINLSSLFSEAQSIYTVVTSALGGTPTSITSTSSRTTSSSSSSTTTSPSTSESATTSPTSASSASAASTPTTSAAAQSSAASSASAAAATTSTGNGGGGSSNTLPIVLGCTLGALALAAFIALFIFCRRRSKKSKAVAKRRDLATSDDESDVWNREKYHRNSFKGPTERTRSLGTTNNTAAAPLMSQHGSGNQHAMYGPNTSQNAYGPAPPVKRFASTDEPREDEMTSYTAHPYSPDHVQSYGRNSEIPAENNHRGETLAAGVGSAALGGLAVHAADRHEDRRSDSRTRKFNGADGTYTEDEQNILPEATMGSTRRSSGSVSRASVKEPWPFMDAHERRSNDSARSRPRSFSRGRDQSGMHESEHHDRNSMPSGTALAGSAAAGGLASATAARATTNQSPHRKGILKQTSKPASVPTSPDNHNATKPTATYDAGPHELESFEVPPPVRTGRERRYSPLGTAAPAGAIGANRSPTRSHRKSWSNSSTPTNVRPTSMLNDSSQDSDIPMVPSRSPRRNSVHSNARYSTANEGTVELPGPGDGQVGATSRELVSPALEPHRASMDNDAIISPISPDTSLPGTWSKAQAEELGMNTEGLAAKSSSQESTAVGYSPLNSNSNSISSASSTEHSSGLVSAIQRIFNSQKQSWPVEESPTIAAPRRSFGDRTMPVPENVYDDNHRVSSVPHRKPAPAMTTQHRGQYDEINNNHVKPTAMPGGWTNETTPLHQTDSRKSVESARSVPLNGRFYSHANTVGEDKNATTAAVPSTNPAVNQSMNTGRARSTSRPGYGIGSGDPFDLARIRTDSSMTGISLSNYTEPTKNTVGDTSNSTNVPNTAAIPQTHAHRTSKPSQEYREPTLAELRREVEEEDRQRRMSWKSNGRRSSTPKKSMDGQRYGNDSELFDLAFPGSQQYDHFYGQEQQHTGSGVGTAY